MQTTVLQLCKALLTEKEFHRVQMLHYFRLFNELIPEGSTSTEYTPVMEWLQERSQHHAKEMHLIDAATLALDLAVSKTPALDAA